MKSSGFCGQWSLMNAEVLFKDTYTKESGGSYGSVPLDKRPTVKHTTSSFSVVHLQLVGQTDKHAGLDPACH